MRQENNEQQYKKEYAEFIDHAAHDLDAPLRKLGVWIARLTEKLGPGQSKEVEEYVQRIHTQLAGMRSMIDSLAGLSRVSTGPEKIEPVPVESVIEEAWLGLKQQVNDTGATIHTAGASLPTLEGDRDQYRQLFQELFSNSLRFRKKDQAPKIEIYASPLGSEEKKALGLEVPLPAGPDYFQITVADNGIGFRQEDAEKVFKPFVQLHGKSAFGGNGIGLAICKRIIDSHRGTIFAKSADDAGARFIFILPQTIN